LGQHSSTFALMGLGCTTHLGCDTSPKALDTGIWSL
jgi:hypothetical protein